MDFSLHSRDIQRRQFPAIGFRKPNRHSSAQILHLLFSEIFPLGKPMEKLPAFLRVEPFKGVFDLSHAIHGLNIPVPRPWTMTNIAT